MSADGALEKGPYLSEDPDVAQEQQFPEGGTRSWLVATGTALIMFCTLGYVNSWGYV